MSKSGAVWGIDIGKCALKAIRCRVSSEPRKLVVEAFDYIEYPQLLSQPDADPVELVRTALTGFLSRNDISRDDVAVSVPGQLGLAKFIKLPPIETKKISDIVTYEARQQIPFPLDEVIWEFQRMPGGIEESGFVIDAEVGLFAMKRDQVYRALAPLTRQKIEVSILQLSPLALANMILYEQLPETSTLDPDNPLQSVVLVTMGVDSTDLVVTNGLRIWQRSMPIGGSHFTKALVSGKKLTFAKAEHLKRNAVRAEDPKEVFRMLKPVFNEFVTELQRSLNFFTGTDRPAKIGKVFLLGNAAKLRGLSDFVAKQLQMDVHRLDVFRGLEGSELASPAFKENRLAFGTAYGLALQAAGESFLKTNLLPPEIRIDRIIRGKKPWAVLAIAALLVGVVISFAGNVRAWKSFSSDNYIQAFSKSDAAGKKSQNAVKAVETEKTERENAIKQRDRLVSVVERRFLAIDLERAIAASLPNESGKAPLAPGDKRSLSDQIADRTELHIQKVDCEFFPDLSVWFTAIKDKWEEEQVLEEEAEGEESDSEKETPVAEEADNAKEKAESDIKAKETGPTGEGFVIEMVGYHFHNEDRHKPLEGAQFVRSTLIRNLSSKNDAVKVLISAGPKKGDEISMADLGISHPLIVRSSTIRDILLGGNASGGSGMGGSGMGGPGMGGPPGGRGRRPPGNPRAGAAPGTVPPDLESGNPDRPDELTLKRYEFTVQFCWKPTILGKPTPEVDENDPASLARGN